MLEFMTILIIKTLVAFAVSLLIVAYSTWIERKVLGHVQLRHGPRRVGFHGLLQPIADGIKGFFKEELIPDNADKPLFLLAPIISIAAAVTLIVVVPFGGEVTLFGRKITLYLTDLDVSVLLVLGISTLGAYGGILGGWSSGNKYGVIGGLRGTAMMISYELSMALAVIAVIMVSGSMSLIDIVNSQTGMWNIVKQPFAFVLFLICGLAEINRTPFDMPEAEAELACGFNVEYSSMKFALFFMAEYCHMFVFAALVTTLFLGGWHGPIVDGPHWFFLKSFLIIFFCVWERSTFPRLRYDQIMAFGWKIMLPFGLLNILLTGLWMLVF